MKKKAKFLYLKFKRYSKHGKTSTRIYHSWANMKARINNKNLSFFNHYGGRGIKYCKKWETFTGFYEDMGDSYKDNLTLDRINNNGNYCKENCRWTTASEQSKNRRPNRWITYKGKTLLCKDWASLYKLPYQSLYYHLRIKNKPLKDSVQYLKNKQTKK